MAEISLILSSSSRGSATIAVALCEAGTGICEIACDSIAALLDARTQIATMMSQGGARMTPSELKKFSLFIGRALFGNDIGQAVAQVQQPLVAKIIATSQDLKAIPWEFAVPPGAVAPQRGVSIVRLLPEFSAPSRAPLPLNGEFRVLLLSASPKTFDRVPWPDIRAGLIAQVKSYLPEMEVVSDTDVPLSRRFVRVVNAATQSAVRRTINDDDPHIVHFVGHGTDRGIALINGPANAATLMDGNAFGAALQAAPSCRLVILSACDVANVQTIHPVDATIGTFAEETMMNAKHLPAIIASQMVINTSSIAMFCEGFYPELLTTGSVDLAVAAGRCNIAAQLGTSTNAPIEWGIPVLYRRLGAGQLFATSAK